MTGLRMTDEEELTLSRVQEETGLTKTEVLLKGLEILNAYRSLGMDRPFFSLELRRLEEEAVRHAEILKRITRREEAVRQMIKELRQVDEILDQHGATRDSLIQVMLEIQAEKGWLPTPDLIWISERVGVPIGDIYEIATFYKAFSLEPRAEHQIRVCLGTACHVRGGVRVLEAIQRELGIRAGETTGDMKFSLETVNCLGCCALGPVIELDGEHHGTPTPRHALKLISKMKKEA